MTTVIRRRRGLALLSVVVGLVLSACSSGPGQANAAAIVGGKTITVDRVQDLVRQAVEIEPATQVLADQRKLGLLSRAVLRELIMQELTETYARENGITVDQGQVDELARQVTESIQPLPTDGSVPADVIVDRAMKRVMDPKTLAKNFLIQATAGQKAAPTLAITFDYVFIAPGGPDNPPGSLREKSAELARKLAADPAKAAELIKAETDAGSQAGMGEVFTPALVADQPELAGTLLFGTEAGNVVAFPAGGDNAGWVVAIIRDRATDAQPQPANDPRLLSTLGSRLLQPMVDRVGLEISPRYGVWDVAAMGVAASEGETTGFVLPVRTPQP